MLGILGLGTFSTIHYIKRLNELALERNGGFSTQEFKLLNVDFNQINAHLPNQFEVLKPLVERAIVELNKMDVCKIIVPNITMHETIDQIDFGSEINSKFVHPLKLAKQILDRKAGNNFVVFGTNYTMNSSYIASFFNEFRVQMKPTEDDQRELNELRTSIYTYGNSINNEQQLAYLIKKYVDSETTVLIACTELSLANSLMENVIDLVELQVRNLG